MNKWALTILAASVAGVGCFILSAHLLPKHILDNYNAMASDNFNTALIIFRDGYRVNRVVLFGEKEAQESFQAGSVTFQVYPASQTTDDNSHDSFNPGIGNTAAHLNGMVVMLASKWIEDKDPAGDVLLQKLLEHIPNFKVSAPGISPVRIGDLESGGPMMKSEAAQWEWRMESDAIKEKPNHEVHRIPHQRRVRTQ